MSVVELRVNSTQCSHQMECSHSSVMLTAGRLTITTSHNLSLYYLICMKQRHFGRKYAFNDSLQVTTDLIFVVAFIYNIWPLVNNIIGLMVEYYPATVEIGVRFPDDAILFSFGRFSIPDRLTTIRDIF